MRFAHIHIVVSDLQRSIDFYQSLGFHEASRERCDAPRMMTEHLMREGTEVVYLQDEHGGEIALQWGECIEQMPPWFHFGFLLPSATEVEELYQRMQVSGIKLRKLKTWPEGVGFRAYDPDGYLLEFCYEANRPCA